MIFTAERIDAKSRTGSGWRAPRPRGGARGDGHRPGDAHREQPPLAIREAKRAVNASFDLPMADGLRAEAEGQPSVCRRAT